MTARRITERSKPESRAYAERTQSSYTLSDSSQFKTEVRTYEGSTLLVLSYGPGLNHFDYSDTTLFDKVRERRANQVRWLGFSTRQPWGNMDLGFAASSFAPNVQKNKVKVSSTLTFCVARGLQVTPGGSYSWVRDQINLPKDAATDEQLLLGLRSLRTDDRYSAKFGPQYTFGSMFNNVVNPRMSSDGR